MDQINENGIIITYEVDYQPANRFNESTTVDVMNTTNTTILLRNLHESIQYNITVRAFTAVGPGPFSSHVLSVTQEARKLLSRSNNKGHFLIKFFLRTISFSHLIFKCNSQ